MVTRYGKRGPIVMHGDGMSRKNSEPTCFVVTRIDNHSKI